MTIILCLLFSGCKKENNTPAAGNNPPVVTNPQTFAEYFPDLTHLQAGADVITVTGTGKPGTIVHSGLSYSIWLENEQKHIISSGTHTGWSYSIIITDPGSGNVATGSLGKYQYLGGRSYYMLFLFSNSLISEAQFVDSL